MGKRTAERESFLTSIIITAVEGGIDYWSAVSGYQWFVSGLTGGTLSPAPGGGDNARVFIHECDDGTEDGYADEGVLVTLDTIARGLALIRSDKDIPYLGDYSRSIIRAADRANTTAPDDSEWIDADLADIIVQVSLFGKVVYA